MLVVSLSSDVINCVDLFSLGIYGGSFSYMEDLCITLGSTLLKKMPDFEYSVLELINWKNNKSTMYINNQ